MTGPLLRAAGEPWDLRKAFDYLAYPEIDFKIPVGTVGDNYDRYRVRLAEMVESARIVEQALDGLPEGPFIADDRKYVLPPRSELSTSMESLIHHFKLVTEGYRVGPGEIYYAIESPARRARLLRPRRRLVEAGPGPLPRPLLRQPAGVQGHVDRRLHRRHDLQPRDARPDPRGGRPVSAVDGAGAASDAAGRPALTEGRVPDRAPEEVPELHEVDCPPELRERIEELMARYPDRKSASIPALWAVQRRYGWCTPGGDPPGGGGDAGDARPTWSRSRASTTSCTPSRSGPTKSPSAPTSAAGCAAATSCSTPSAPPPRATRTSSSPGSSASGPATSPRWPRSTSATSARSRRPRRRRRSSSCCAGGEVLPEKALEAQARRWPGDTPDAGSADGRMPETRVLLEHAEDPALRTLDGYRGYGGYADPGAGLPRDGGRRGPQGARRLRPARARRRRLLDGQKGLLPAARRDGQVPLLQRRRVRAGRLQGPRADAAQPPPADRGDRDRRPRRRRRPRLHLHPRRVRPPGRHPRRARSPRPTRPATSARTSSAATATSSWSSTAAPAPTSAARRRRCSTRSRASAATRA